MMAPKNPNNGLATIPRLNLFPVPRMQSDLFLSEPPYENWYLRIHQQAKTMYNAPILPVQNTNKVCDLHGSLALNVSKASGIFSRT
jgi:hypothetical protein